MLNLLTFSTKRRKKPRLSNWPKSRAFCCNVGFITALAATTAVRPLGKQARPDRKRTKGSKPPQKPPFCSQIPAKRRISPTKPPYCACCPIRPCPRFAFRKANARPPTETWKIPLKIVLIFKSLMLGTGAFYTFLVSSERIGLRGRRCRF
jgi:hypothetical protein